MVCNALEKGNIDMESINAVVGRGGALRPIEGGTYLINGKMIEDLKVGVQGNTLQI